MFRKVGALLAALLALVALAVAATASANDKEEDFGPDPQETNIPYLGWAGSQILVKKCFGAGHDGNGDAQAALDSSGISLISALARGKFRIEDWSGDVNQQPVFLNDLDGDVVPTVEGSIFRGTKLCFGVHVTSQKAGMAVIKLAVRPDLLGLFPGLQVLAKHQFLVIFLRSQAPVIDEISATEQGGWNVGDPAGDGVFQPPYEDGLDSVYGLVKINVKGTFPLANNFAGIDADNSITLPDDWKFLAEKFAVDKSTNEPGAASARWDIHDDQAAGHALLYSPANDPLDAGAADHHVNSFCDVGTNTATDAVDNCLGGLFSDDDFGPFSDIHGGFFAIGPFDPLRRFTSYFPDGKLDSGDAPMPALQIDVSLGANSIGSLEKADKDKVYRVDPDEDDGYPHNLNAPFYRAWIPAVGISGSTHPLEGLDTEKYYEGRSGVAGSFANNYPGFLDEGKYDYWSIFVKAERDEGYNDCRDPLGNLFPKPSGNTKVAVYTDEHGEAYVKFRPYTGLRLTPDSNNRCDVRPGLYGTATIQAKSIYPDQPVLWDQENKLSNTLTKTANQIFNKTLTCIPKGTNEAFCVEKIVDFNGDPIADAKVKFTTSGDAANIDPDAAVLGGFDTTEQYVVDNPADDDYVVIKTNKPTTDPAHPLRGGQAGVLVTHSQDVCIDVTAENLGTQWVRGETPGVKRFFEFNPRTGLACGANTGGPVGPPPADAGGNNTGGNTNTGGTNTTTTGAGGSSVVVSLGGPVIKADPVLQVSTSPIVVNSGAAKLFSVKVLQSKLGRYLVVNVKGKAKTAKLRIVFVNKKGKALKTVTRVVPTNRAFKIANLKLPKAAATVRASVLSA